MSEALSPAEVASASPSRRSTSPDAASAAPQQQQSWVHGPFLSLPDDESTIQLDG